MTRPASLRAGSKQSLAVCIKRTTFGPQQLPHVGCHGGTMYHMYATVVRSLLTEWCVATDQIPDTKWFLSRPYPGCTQAVPRPYLGRTQAVTLCNTCSFFGLQHAARTIKPNGSPRLDAALIDLSKPMTPFQGMHYGNTLGVHACLRLCCR